MNTILKTGKTTRRNPAILPPVPKSGTTIQPLMSPDQIYQVEDDIINTTPSGQSLYIAEYSLPGLKDGPSVGTPASDAQRQILSDIQAAIQRGVQVYIITDNRPGKKGGQAHNQDTINYLHQMGAYILPYPTQYVAIDHSKLVANENYAVVSSANWSAHQADSPDNNTGFFFAGAAAHNGIVHSFLPQWNFAVSQDNTGWASNYPTPNINPVMLPDPKVTWLNTAPAAESGAKTDTTEIKEAYLNLIRKAANGPANAYLYLEQLDVSNMDVVHALIQAKQQNPSLDIRIIADPNQYLNAIQQEQKSGKIPLAVQAYNALTQAGIQFKFANINPHPPGPEGQYPQQFHDKFMVYNDQEVINGSGNLSEAGMDPDNGSKYLHNREIDVDVVDSASAQAYKQKFLNDWTNTSDDPNIAAQDGNTNANLHGLSSLVDSFCHLGHRKPKTQKILTV
jgi:phosphatidylserine/phosphatidylglycerophosphate/cardiolipin synthase-like enzyme